MNKVECKFHSSFKETLWFSKCFPLPISLFNWKWCTLLHNHGHNSVCKVFLVTFSFCVIQVYVSSKNSIESSVSSVKKQKNKKNRTKLNKKNTTCYAKCIQIIILSMDRVTLTFFGFSSLLLTKH